MEVRYLTVTMEQKGIDKLKILASGFDINISIVNDCHFVMNPKMKYQDWKLTGELKEIEKFLHRMYNDNFMKISKIS